MSDEPIFSRAEIDKIAELASLELSDAEKETFAAQFAEILDYVRKLEAVPLPDLHDHPPDNADPFRDDEPRDSGVSADEFSPHVEDRHFKVPKVIE